MPLAVRLPPPMGGECTRTMFQNFMCSFRPRDYRVVFFIAKKPRMVCLRGCAGGGVRVVVSVMEQADVGHRHCNAVFVAGLDDVVVADGAAALCDVGDAALMRALDVVAEREEGV